MKWYFRLKGDIPDNFYKVLEYLDEMKVKKANNLPINIGGVENVLVSFESDGERSEYVQRYSIKYVSKDSFTLRVYYGKNVLYCQPF